MKNHSEFFFVHFRSLSSFTRNFLVELFHTQHLCAIVRTNFRFIYLPFHFSHWRWCWCCFCCRCCFFQRSHFIRESRNEKKKAERKSKSVNARELKTVTGNEKSNKKKCENLLFVWIVVCLISTHSHKKNNKN